MKKFMSHVNFTVGHSVSIFCGSPLLDMIGERLALGLGVFLLFLFVGADLFYLNTLTYNSIVETGNLMGTEHSLKCFSRNCL